MDGAHTHGHGSGGGGGTAVLVVLAAVLAAAVARPVIHAAIEVVQVVLIAAVVIVGVDAAGLVGLLTWRWRRSQADAARNRPPLAPKLVRAAQPLPEPERSAAALPPPGGPREIHLHLHGVSAEDVAAIIERGRQDGPASLR
jgi:hypothetical protein